MIRHGTLSAVSDRYTHSFALTLFFDLGLAVLSVGVQVRHERKA